MVHFHCDNTYKADVNATFDQSTHNGIMEALGTILGVVGIVIGGGDGGDGN
ncbi:MAG TPA: hypothetical protein VEH06_12640 [Candidatus Bathyarchaeia archaeon]|nr:hypothetical protein [Candidatus Bathyarchaeia archaeon]